jgi:ligand-binding SRPBCC domain-containing protein
MSTIVLETTVNAPIHRVFDLARSIDLHKITASHTNEKAVAGRTSGLINESETVTWRAKHLGVVQHLTSVITKMEGPHYFEDQMLKGPFKKIFHKHYFCLKDGKTIMKDVFEFESPLGWLGRIVDKLYMRKYLEAFLLQRNIKIKDFAENEDKWMQVLNIY